ncbi:MAG: pyridoxamine 5'-phosphate oxidase family protein [Syntrophomonadaceae bacterium]|jgi:hypothetical protein|nr:pyridoxamine 5'-phosphate oxidase family protein [Syntrophomonadaceae bacterium]
MERFEGDFLPPAWYAFFATDTMVGVVSTLDADGYPRGAPMSQFYAPSDRVLLMAAQNQSRTYGNAVRTGKLAVTFLGASDLVFTVQGQAAVLSPRMDSNPHLGILAVFLTRVAGNPACDVVVTGGITTEFRGPHWQRRLETWLAELRGYTLEDVRHLAPPGHPLARG